MNKWKKRELKYELKYCGKAFGLMLLGVALAAASGALFFWLLMTIIVPILAVFGFFGGIGIVLVSGWDFLKSFGRLLQISFRNYPSYE
jgi:hypothetical protein